jgi:mevalonate kinase
MIAASSPAKVILFGEHAVVYGMGAIALSLDLRMDLTIRPSERTSVNGTSLDAPKNRYIKWAFENLWSGGPLMMTTRSDIPAASGLGSSAALSCCIAAALRSLVERPDEERIARDAFDVEYNTQGRASPTDTSCSCHGRAIRVSLEKGVDLLWSLGKDDRVWHIHDLDPPELTMVVGFTRTPSITSIQVRKVRNYYDRSGFAKEVIAEIGTIVDDGMRAIREGDLVRIGELMNRNHACLSILGVNTKELQKLKDACDPISYGVKLTGAGGGGSIIALTDDPDRVSKAIAAKGGRPYIAPVARNGTVVVDSPDSERAQ